MFKFRELLGIIEPLIVNDIRQECGMIILKYCKKPSLKLDDFMNMKSEIIEFSKSNLNKTIHENNDFPNFGLPWREIDLAIDYIESFDFEFLLNQNTYENNEYSQVYNYKQHLFNIDTSIFSNNITKYDQEIEEKMFYLLKNKYMETLLNNYCSSKNLNLILNKFSIFNIKFNERMKLVSLFKNCFLDHSFKNIDNIVYFENNNYIFEKSEFLKCSKIILQEIIDERKVLNLSNNFTFKKDTIKENLFKDQIIKLNECRAEIIVKQIKEYGLNTIASLIISLENKINYSKSYLMFLLNLCIPYDFFSSLKDSYITCFKPSKLNYFVYLFHLINEIENTEITNYKTYIVPGLLGVMVAGIINNQSKQRIIQEIIYIFNRHHKTSIPYPPQILKILNYLDETPSDIIKYNPYISAMHEDSNSIFFNNIKNNRYLKFDEKKNLKIKELIMNTAEINDINKESLINNLNMAIRENTDVYVQLFPISVKSNLKKYKVKMPLNIIEALEIFNSMINLNIQIEEVKLSTQEIDEKTPILNFLKTIKNDSIRIQLIDKYNAMIDKEDVNSKNFVERFDSKDDRRFFQKILKIPFDNSSELNYNISDFYNKINKTHYGMNKVKNKIAEAMLVLSRNKASSPPVICLVGAPGVGKTSLINSIGLALNRKISKISLNTSGDIQSLLSGFSNTYRNSQNGRITESFIKTGVNNPLILLDEIDKIQNSRTGTNIENSLLGLLDPSQNTEFFDEYFGFDFDVSKVMFICTANSVNELSKPLLDRMIIINIDGYNDSEKLIIAEKYLMNKIIEKNGVLESDNFNLSTETIKYIINSYSNESGIRKLEQILDEICKKYLFEKEINNIILDLSIPNLIKIIDKKPFITTGDNIYENYGISNGLFACSSGMSGGVLTIQSSIVTGKGNMRDLGLLGKMTTNSVQIIYNLLKLKQVNWGIPPSLFKTKDICINYGGSQSVDGPSAGTATVCSIISSIKNTPISKNIAMSGEIDLHGNILPIGGIRNKIMGAKKEGIIKFFFPINNKYDIEKLEDEIKNDIEIVLVSKIEEILINLKLI